jgi:formate hydrogenlyase subunit 4
MTWALTLAQAAAYLLLAPLFAGLVDWLKARLQGRRGPDPAQPYRDLRKLLGKAPSVPGPASGVFLLAAPLAFTCLGLLGFALPLFLVPALEMDLLLALALLGLARFVTALAAFDAASPFGPMSGGRQLFVHTLAEPALLLVVYVLALGNDTTGLASLTTGGNPWAEPAVPLALGALGYVLLASSGRLPFDNPATHLELTMVEQGTRLEHSGRALALLEWADAMRLTVALTLLANLAVPWGVTAERAPLPVLLAFLAYLAKVGGLLLALAWWEVVHAKARLRAVASPLLLALGALLFAVVSLVVQDL